MTSTSFERFAGICAILAGLDGFCYAVSFIVVGRSDPALSKLLSSLFLMLGGLLATPVLIALYYRLRETGDALALWAAALGFLGAAGAIMHGGFDLANSANPPPEAVTTMMADLPSQANARGLLTFGIAGIARLVISGMIRCSGTLPGRLGIVGYISGALLIILYLGRLILLNPAHPVIVVAAVVDGFLINPLWYIWLGAALRRERPAQT